MACFVVEALSVSWAEGARWFEDTLVHANLAINAMMRQSEGWCFQRGADQWAFFKSPNVVGGISPGGAYVRHWVPELGPLSTEFLACPRAALATALRAAGVVFGITYGHCCPTGQDARPRRLEEAVLANPAANNTAGQDIVQVKRLSVTSPDMRPQHLPTARGSRCVRRRLQARRRGLGND